MSPPRLEWLFVLLPILAALILFFCLRVRNARQRANKQADEEAIRAPTISALPLPPQNSGMITAQHLSLPPILMDRHNRRQPLLRFSSPPQTSRLSTNSLMSASSFWRRLQPSDIDVSAPGRRRRRRRPRPPRTPPPVYPGSPPPHYEDVIGPEDEPLAQVQTRMGTTSQQREELEHQAEDEPLVQLQHRLIADPD
ncbi:hypothetical protein J3Q64DRAFT_1752573 [Phycomyces blakesleeanus]|uniref:Uncharacterized protein n=2 Tax=Phycomyces blakesleeanus TaxID=4837 RepID=A0A162X7B8_PHYB8|nr:hypothetical protein PHYBLDRAFT_65147 [Phycomyces blakesleeanus NRRL 1555(-)]OAD72925.1 hypothetical protein PHYBLDRAFT_65147 [Phycomyces blakesleeanus NRRL 1555(-)]|eukprot:XP_018290965.1 hypothetical protein PHYBLDRAFT_65147 [Phycomyces blakesleeanus NRRL 1555(-)]